MTAAQVDMFAPPAAGSRPWPLSPAPAGGAITSPAFTMRPYQVGALEGGTVGGELYPGIFPALETNRSTLAVLATGTGKTAIQAEAAARAKGRVLVLQYGNDLITQNRDKLAGWTREYVALEQAGDEAGVHSRIVMASVSTLRDARLQRFAAKHKFDLILADEAHHATAATWRAIIDAFPDAKVAGFTATPRPKGMGRVFDSVAYEYGIDRAIADAWLTDIDVIPISVRIDLSGVGTAKGELVQADLDAAVARCAKDIADGLLDDKVPRVRSVIFTPGVMTAHATAEHLNARIPGCARSVDGKMDKDLRRRILEEYAAGEFPYLLNCRVLVEGWDDPQTVGVMVSACIQSGGMFTQMVGRGTRLWPGIDRLATADERRAAIAASPKPKMLLLDPHYLSQQHELASPVDLVGGAMDEETRVEAKKVLREKGGNVAGAVKEAKDRVEARKAAIAAAAVRIRKAADHAATLARAVEVGKPVNIFKMLRVRRADETAYVRPEDRPTAKQLGLLKAWGIPAVATQQEFRRLMGVDGKRQKAGKCRLAGVHWLARYGVNGWTLTRDQALRVRSAIADNGYRAISPEKLDACLARAPGEEAE